jgi:hypothetical protein
MSPNKSASVPNVPTPTERPRRQITHDQIAERARGLWRERGYPAGQDDAIWLEAESKLQAEAESQPVSGTPARPYANEPAQPVRSKTKSRDPSDAAVQTRSNTDAQSKRSAGKLRNQ